MRKLEVGLSYSFNYEGQILRGLYTKKSKASETRLKVTLYVFDPEHEGEGENAFWQYRIYKKQLCKDALAGNDATVVRDKIPRALKIAKVPAGLERYRRGGGQNPIKGKLINSLASIETAKREGGLTIRKKSTVVKKRRKKTHGVYKLPDFSYLTDKVEVYKKPGAVKKERVSKTAKKNIRKATSTKK